MIHIVEGEHSVARCMCIASEVTSVCLCPVNCEIEASSDQTAMSTALGGGFHL